MIPAQRWMQIHEPFHILGELIVVLCDHLEGWGIGGKFQRERIYVYLSLIHIVVWQKPTHDCKAVILQLKKKGRPWWSSVETSLFPCREHRFDPWLGNWAEQHDQINKQIKWINSIILKFFLKSQLHLVHAFKCHQYAEDSEIYFVMLICLLTGFR